MKKKRKKKAILPFYPPTFQFQPCMKATFALGSRLGSAPDVPKSDEMKECMQFAVRLFGKDSGPVDICSNDLDLKIFSKQLTNKLLVHYNTVYVGDQMYVQIPLEGSRDSFVALLDYAEEHGVARVIVCLDRNSQNFRDMVKTFRFMGFEHAQPSLTLVSIKECQSNGSPGASSSHGFYFLGCDMD